MCRRGGFSDGRTPHCLDRRRVFSVRRVRPGPSPAPRGAAAAKGRKARRRRRARVYKRAAAASGAFCGKGGARERGDGGFLRQMHLPEAKKTSEQSGLCTGAAVFQTGVRHIVSTGGAFFSVRRARPRPIPRAARCGSRKRLVATASRCERACKRTGEPSVTFCGKGGARERCDGGFFAADASARSKKDVGAKRTMRRRGGFSDGRTPYCLAQWHAFPGAACTPRPISRAARRGSRKRLVATASRCERACKRTGEPSGAFCGKGGARERGDGGFIAADSSAKSKKDAGAKRTLLRRGGLGERI